MVVDSHLGDVPAIENRTQPVIDDFLLPAGVHIAYASADAATDSPLNGLIARCDGFARDVFKNIADAPVSNLILAAGSPWRAHRFWRFPSRLP
jgi:hypothetical protein